MTKALILKRSDSRFVEPEEKPTLQVACNESQRGEK
jgi:hypothetical protein